ncbi:hypothetical protein GHT06_009003 [Daphnia sinensis]|uniref:Anaphase-promoting complex subunit 7 n=1 Tax=Daphnia sinensis TaxID=1820382 RepID=A0AAD5L2A8_9CRUS|nr:hypothetical protein GHT06_009003 [Daphnia sinensis]
MILQEQIQILFDNKLFTNIVALAPMVLSATDNNTELLPPASIAQTMVYLADSYLEQKEYGKAEVYYRKALDLRKTLSKQRGLGSSAAKELSAETEIRYQMHICHLALKQPVQALLVLQGIPAKLRSVKVNMALGKLYVMNGLERPAISAFKEVIRECPLAIEATLALIKLGVSYVELVRLIFNGNPSNNLDWIAQWIKGQCHLHSCEYLSASTIFCHLQDTSLLKDDVTNLISQGTTFFLAGDFTSALQPLQRAHALDPLSLKGMDILAVVLANEKKSAELEALALKLISVSDSSFEPWVAMGYHYLLSRKLTRALYLAHKACTCCTPSPGIEPLILKGTVLQELKKWPEAITHFREGLQIAPHRFEIYRGIVHCYLALQRSREAMNIAASSLHHIGHTPRTFTLYASVLLKDPVTTAKGKVFLERALNMDPRYAPAVFLLIDSYEQAGQRSKAIELLNKQINQQPSNRLHHILGDLLVKNGEMDKALEQYNSALMLEPNNVKTMEAINRLENALVAKLENHLDLEADDIPDSDEEPTIEEVDIDPMGGMWADMNLDQFR